MWQNYEPASFAIIKVLSYFNSDPQVFFIVTSFFVCAFFLSGIYSYCANFALGVFLFIGMYFYFESFNLVRQYVSMAVIFYFGTKYIVEEKKNFVIASILLASLFHFSALFVVPFYLLSRKLYRRFFYCVFLAASLVMFFLYPWVEGFLFRYLLGYSSYAEYSRPGSAYALLIISSLMFLYAISKRKIIRNSQPLVVVSLNMVFFSIPFFLFSSHNIMFYRVGAFLAMFSIYLMPNIIQQTHKGVLNAGFLTIMSIVLLNFMYRLYNNGAGVFPYSMSFDIFI